MPGITYIPQQQNPFVRDFFQLLQNAALQRASQNFRAKEAELDREQTGKLYRLKEADLELKSAKFRRESSTDVTPVEYGGKTLGYMRGNKFIPEKEFKQGALLEQYDFAKKQFEQGIGKDPGSFTEWKKATTPSTQINIGEKVALASAKKKATKDIEFKDYIRTPKFKYDIEKSVKDRVGPETWNDRMESEEKTEAVFEATNQAIIEGFPNETVRFGIYKGKQGWWSFDEEGNPVRLVKKWADFVPRQRRR